MKTTTKEQNEQKVTNRLLKIRSMVVDFMKENNIKYQKMTTELGQYYTTVTIGDFCELKISNHQTELNLVQKNQILSTYEVR